MTKTLNWLLQVKNIFYVYIILFSLAVINSPSSGSAKYITDSVGSPLLVQLVLAVAAFSAFVGICTTFQPLKFWLYTSPFVLYSFTICWLSFTQPNGKPVTAFFTFFLFIMLPVCITWEKLNASNK